MVVVAIVGILAALGSVAYMRYVKQGKITKLKQYAMDVARGQEQFRSRHGYYYPDDGTQREYQANQQDYENLLEFDQVVISGVTIETTAGDNTTTCGAFCEGFDTPAGESWYAVKITQSLGEDTGEDTTVIMNSNLPEPAVLNEGE
jgi:type II secretory pathway pseudopilin PulG